MSSNDYVPAVNPKPDLMTRARQLAMDSIAILRTFDPIAFVIAVVCSMVLLGMLHLNVLASLVLAAMTYVGTTLLRPHTAPAVPAPPPSAGEEAYAQSRASCARMLTVAKEITDPTVRRQVRAVQAKFSKMLDVMDEDQKFVSTSEYYSGLVRPFERILGEYLRLSSRNVPSAVPQLRRFERDVVPRTEAVAEAFYQDYHQMDVIDLAALMEIHRLNLDSLSPDDEEDDGNDDTTDDQDGATRT